MQVYRSEHRACMCMTVFLQIYNTRKNSKKNISNFICQKSAFRIFAKTDMSCANIVEEIFNTNSLQILSGTGLLKDSEISKCWPGYRNSFLLREVKYRHLTKKKSKPFCSGWKQKRASDILEDNTSSRYSNTIKNSANFSKRAYDVCSISWQQQLFKIKELSSSTQ